MNPVSFTVQEMAAQTGLRASTLRYYEGLGLLGEVPRSRSGHRAYAEKHLHRLRFLQLLAQTGMPLETMRHFAQLDDAGAATAPARLALLRAHQRDLQARIDRLSAQSGALEDKIGYYRGVCRKYDLPVPAEDD